MLHSRQLPAHRFQFVEQIQQLSVGELVAVEFGQPRRRRGVRGDRGGNPVRTHTRTLVRTTDKKPRDVTAETKGAQGFTCYGQLWHLWMNSARRRCFW